MPEDKVTIKRVNLFTAIPRVPAVFGGLDAERSRISRWLPALSESVIPDRRHLFNSVVSYVVRNAQRKIFSNQPHDERFLITELRI